MKILVLQGSPRRKGNTSRLASAFIEGAEQAGHEVVRFDVAGMDIGGCKGCHACWKRDGQCIFDDDMQQIYDCADTFDTLVLAAPVYFFTFPAQIKSVIDRLEAKMNNDPVPFKNAVLLTTLYQSIDSGAAEPLLVTYRKIVDYLGWNDLGTIVVPHLDEPADIEGNPALEEARKLGASL